MNVAITEIYINYDVQGKYLDRSGMDNLKTYFASCASSGLRINIIQEIWSKQTLILKEAVARTLLLYTDLTRPGGNMSSFIKSLDAEIGFPSSYWDDYTSEFSIIVLACRKPTRASAASEREI
jgi:hypothetical protein